MKNATIVCDPMSSRTSVQYSLVNLVLKTLKGYERVNIISPYIPENRIDALKRNENSQVISASGRRKLLHLLYRLLERNEAMLWSFSWLMEVVFRANASLFAPKEGLVAKNTVINIAYTMPVKCKLLWNQASPPLDTLRQMGQTNFLAKIIVGVFGPLIGVLDKKLQKRHFSQASIFINNSEYLKQTFSERNYPSEVVVHVPKEFPEFPLGLKKASRDYVLAYIGKETEINTLIELANRGVKLICFGAKIPFGTSLTKIKELLDFRGFVEESELNELYYNALYTAFPFTDEPFGWVPLESLYYGTPVLTYNKQGPAETVTNGITGWLVESSSQFIDKAVELWNSSETGISQQACRERADYFSFSKTEQQLTALLSENKDEQ